MAHCGECVCWSLCFLSTRWLTVGSVCVLCWWQDCYLAYMLNEFSGQTCMVFVATCNNAQRLALLLRNLGFRAMCLHGYVRLSTASLWGTRP
jgi:hypothetical protein